MTKTTIIAKMTKDSEVEVDVLLREVSTDGVEVAIGKQDGRLIKSDRQLEGNVWLSSSQKEFPVAISQVVMDDKEELKDNGMDPDNRLFFKINDVNEVNWPKEDGMDSLKWLFDISNISKYVRLPISVGIGPSNLFQDIFNCLNEVRLPIQAGIETLKKLFDKSLWNRYRYHK